MLNELLESSETRWEEKARIERIVDIINFNFKIFFFRGVDKSIRG